MERLTARKDFGCACWNGEQPLSTLERYLQLLDKVCAYEDTGKTPSEITDRLAKTADGRRQEVVRCGKCVSSYAGHCAYGGTCRAYCGRGISMGGERRDKE